MVAFCMLNALVVSLVPSEQTLREMIKYDGKYWPRDKDYYLAYGPLAFPAYRAILDDKKSKDLDLFVILSVLYGTKGTIDTFRHQLFRLLTHEHDNIREMATELLGRFATGADAPQFCILLYDPNRYVIFRAAEALVKVGDRNVLNAMELWQTSKSNTAHPGYRAVVKDFENKLRKRLDKEEADRKNAPAKPATPP
jgi:hypothetical protein